MCSGSLFTSNTLMEGGLKKENHGELPRCSVLLEFSATNDVATFRTEVEEKKSAVDEASFWYGRRIGSRKMGLEERTPLMIAAMFGSVEVLKYIIGTSKVDVNRVCGMDRVSALHCAVAGGAASSAEVVKLLLDVSADGNCVDANGNKPLDLVASISRSSIRRKVIELLKGDSDGDGDFEEQTVTMTQLLKEGTEKKEYPIDVSLPDINNGVYGTDEFRMYTFKVKPCSRAYSHDWTVCPFVHPGENARRRDPRKYPYTCVPCPEFRKGSCPKGDGCEYAHGIFESWLHPSQYRTRLCKDETGCSRKVCFFAHKPEELRPVYASTGSAVAAVDIAPMSPLALGSSLSSSPTTSTSPSSPGGLWQNKVNLNLNVTPLNLQLSGSRLKTAFSARDFDIETESISPMRLSSPTRWNTDYMIRDTKPANLDDAFRTLDSSMFSPLQGLSMKSSSSTTTTQMMSPNGLQIRQNMNQLRSSYPATVPASSPSYGFDTSAAVAAAVMNSRSSAFTKRSQSFVDRGAAAAVTARATNSASMMSSSQLWGPPGGKLDWGVQGDELNKLRRSASFGFQGNNHVSTANTVVDEPDVSWVNSLVKDVTPVGPTQFGSEKKQLYNYGIQERVPTWVEQMYIEQEQMVA